MWLLSGMRRDCWPRGAPRIQVLLCICSMTGFSIGSSIATWTFCCSVPQTSAIICCLRGICARHCVRRSGHDVIAIPADEPEVAEWVKSRGWKGTVWRVRRRMDVPQVDGPVVAFCGIARPEQFFRGLESGRSAPGGTVRFPGPPSLHRRRSGAGDVSWRKRPARRYY